MSIERIKEVLKIEELVGEALTLTGKGRVLSTVEHDSLKIFTTTQSWFRFSEGCGGDIIDWYRYQHKCDFRRALEALAEKAGVELEPLTPEKQKELDDERAGRAILAMAAVHYHRTLVHHPGAKAAREYCHSRAWDDATIEREMIGYVLPSNSAVGSSSDKVDLSLEQSLSQRLREADLLDHPMAKAVLSIPQGMIVYVHRRGGHVLYLSGRSIEGKKHYNLPTELSSGKHPYTNSPADSKLSAHVLVEGQADAISLGQLGCASTALCGVHAEQVKDVTHVWLDADDAGSEKELELALEAGPLVKIAHSCYDDPNDFLISQGDPEQIYSLPDILDKAQDSIIALAEYASSPDCEDEDGTISLLMDLFDELNKMAASRLKPLLVKTLGVATRDFNEMRKARCDERKNAEKDEKASPDSYITTYGSYLGEILFEQCFSVAPDGTKHAFYACRMPDGSIEKKQFVNVAGTTYVPDIPTDERDVLMKNVVLLPSDAEEYGTEQQLFDDAKAFIHRWIDVDPFSEQLFTYYVFLSWLYDCFHIVPYLRALGDTGTGKTRMMKTVGALCYRPFFIDGATSEAALFHMIDKVRGTMILDEADFDNSSMGALVTKILNSGNSRFNTIIRTVPNADGGYDLIAYDVYSPKCIAGREMFADRAVESRCLVYRTNTKRPRKDIKRNLDNQFYEDAQRLRNKFLMFRLKKFQPEIKIPEELSDENIEPRLDQVSMPIKAVIDDPKMLEDLTVFIQAYNEQLVSDRQLTTEAVVVQALAQIHYKPEMKVFGPEKDFSIGNIAKRTAELLAKFDPDEKVSPRKVGAILNSLGLTERTRNNEGQRLLVIKEDNLESLMRRYGVNSATDVELNAFS